MKKIFLAIAILLSACAANAQLANTKWKVTLALDTPLDVIFYFKKDTVTVFFAADNSVGEEMTYTATDTTFTIQKIWGKAIAATDQRAVTTSRLKKL